MSKTFQRAKWIIAIAVVTGCVATYVNPVSAELVLFPGSSRGISKSLSASRDNNIFAWQYIPRQVKMAGVDIAWGGYRFETTTLRLGFSSMIELSSDDNDEPAFFHGGPGVDLWRGGFGGSAALSFDERAREWFGPRGGLELALSFRHESDHITGEETGDREPKYETVPNIGDFIGPEAAIRFPVGLIDTDVRMQYKIFVSGNDSGYKHGPGADLIFRWPIKPKLHLFASTFGEYLVGNEVTQHGHETGIPNSYFVRQLAGIILPGVGGDLQLFTSVRAGHGKGKLVFNEELLLGWGVRLDISGAFDRLGWGRE